MDTELEPLLNEVATQLLMLDEANPSAGIDEILNALQKVAEKCASDERLKRLADSCAFLVKQQKFLNPKALLKLINDLLSQAQIFLKRPEGVQFPGEEQNKTDSEETNGAVDSQFLVEFIEKHASMMDEFEAAIVELRYRRSNPEENEADLADAFKEFRRYAKGYIHNVKGDSGSIGLIGIERVCHFVEDHLVEAQPECILDPLLNFKEWVVACMQSFSKGESVTEASKDFMERFKDGCAQSRLGKRTGEAEATAPMAKETEHTEADVSNSQELADKKRAELNKALQEELPAEANVDLLAELLAEGVAQTQAVSTTTEPEWESTADEPQSDSDTGSMYPLGGDIEVLPEFCAEAEDHLNVVESILLDSDGNYTKEHIDSIFRGIHSIKGASSYFSLKEMMESSHKTETLLDEVRDGKRVLNKPLAELVLAYVDLQKKLIERAQNALKSDKLVRGCAQTAQYLEQLALVQDGVAQGLGELKKTASKLTAPQAAAESSGIPAERLAASPEPNDPSPERNSAGKSEKLEVKNFVKIDTQRLDLLIDSIGEMCIYSSMLVQSCRELLGGNERILKTTHQVEKFSRDLQNIGMSMRLIPIRGLFQKMSRLVWDTSKKIGKDVKFQMHGEDTELDRSIIDKLADPLMHMVRNALDHGVEPPAEREANGKPRAGTVTISAAHAGGSIHVKVEDDGRGLDPDKLIRKAIEKGILSEGQSLSRSEAFSLIFAPGFSTAAVVTDISGRGVGMDVVKRNIESMRGRVHIESELGKGTSFLIELPLTLAIIDGILVGLGRENYIIPTLSVVEFMRPAPNSIVRALDRGETYQFRGRYLPIYRLGKLFGIEARVKDPADSIFVIVETGGEMAALMVDEIVGTYSSVIKSIGDMFEQGRGVAGCAIMPNGDVALIVDVRSLVQTAKSCYTWQVDEAALQAAGQETGGQ